MGRLLKSLLLVVTLVALVSLGGLGAYAAPILLPLLLIAASQSGRLMRTVWALLASAVAAEAFWALTYQMVGEAQPVIWALPLVAGCIAGTTILNTRKAEATSRGKSVAAWNDQASSRTRLA